MRPDVRLVDAPAQQHVAPAHDPDDDAPTLRILPLAADDSVASTGREPSIAPGLPPGSSRSLYRLCGIDHEDDLITLLYGWTRSYGGLHPRFAFKSRLGEGSQGYIFGLYDRDCRREVAFKTLNSSECDPGDIARFINEAQITAQLEHPGIVPVHDFGVMPSGAVFYTMKRVQGQSLAEYFSTRFGHEEHRFHLLEIVLRVCETVAFAHSRGVIHRDLKPRNIMVGDYGEVLVIDWGLAKVLPGANREQAVTITQDHGANRGDDHGTRSGQAIGTPAYMSPEQARGEVVDPRGDIYSLGVILYEVLAGSSPYQRGDVKRTLEQVSSNVWLRLDHHVRGRELPRSLIAIVHKAMAHFPHQRYQSVDLLIADLQQFIAGQAVSAYRETILERIVRLLHAQRRVLWVLVLAAIMACGFIAARDLYHTHLAVLSGHTLPSGADYGAAGDAASLGAPERPMPAGEPRLVADLALRNDDAASIHIAQLRYQEELQLHPGDPLLRDMARTAGTLWSILSEGQARSAGTAAKDGALAGEQALIRNYRSRQLEEALERAQIALGHGAPEEARLQLDEAALWQPGDVRLEEMMQRTQEALRPPSSR